VNKQTVDDHLFLHVGVTYNKESILSQLLSANFNLVIIDDVGIRPSIQGIPYHLVYRKSYQEIRTIIESIISEKGHTLSTTTIFTLADGSVDLVNRLLTDFGKPNISKLTGPLRDKFWVRKILNENGIEHLPFLTLVKEPAEIPKALDSQFPLMVKPVSSMASRNINKVHNNDQLRTACLSILAKNKTFITVDHGEVVVEELYNQPDHALIETFFKGKKLSVETIVINNQMLFHAVVAIMEFDNDRSHAIVDIADPNIFEPKIEKCLSKYLSSVINALEIESSLLSIEIFYNHTSNSFHLIEVDFRMGGDNIYDIVLEAYGIDMVAQFLKISAGISNNIQCSIVPQNKISVAYYFMSKAGGRFEPYINELYGSQIIWNFKPGENVRKFATAQYYRVGTIIFSVEKDLSDNRINQLFNNSNSYFSVSSETVMPKSALVKAIDRPGIILFLCLTAMFFQLIIFMFPDFASNSMNTFLIPTSVLLLLYFTFLYEKNRRYLERKAEELTQVLAQESKVNSRIEDLLDESTQQLISSRAEVEVAKIAKQVSHDIRSPLTALQIALSDVSGISEDKRTLVRTATQRINEIANNLLSRSKNNRNQLPSRPIKTSFLVSRALGAVISEKQVQFTSIPKLKFTFRVQTTHYDLFSPVNESDFKTIISNLLNNSVEAIVDDAQIEICLEGHQQNFLSIKISDKGRGIPIDILSKIGEQGFSFGKENQGLSGSGLGIYHAKNTVESWGGKLEITSISGKGTTIVLIIPRVLFQFPKN
jgi:signal transduction histidine kinase